MRALLLLLICCLLGQSVRGESWQLLFLGDTALASSYRQTRETLTRLNRQPTDAFEPLALFLRQQDAVIANLETALWDGGPSPYQGRKDYVHADPTPFARLLASYGFAAVSLANNHALDYGLPGWRSTERALRQAGISPFGAGGNRDQAWQPWRFAPPGGRVPIAVFGACETIRPLDRRGWYATEQKPGMARLDIDQLRQRIQRLEEASPEVFVILFVHWGQNYALRSDAQEAEARAIIEAGVDLIIGHGAHRLQEIASHQGRWILHGIGNGIFLTPGRYQKLDQPGYSVLAQLTVEETAGPTALRLYPILSDNRRTDYQPRFLTVPEARECYQSVLAASGLPPSLTAEIQLSTDLEPPFLQLTLQLPPAPR